MLEVLDDVQAGDGSGADDIDVKDRRLLDRKFVAHQVFATSHDQKDVVCRPITVSFLKASTIASRVGASAKTMA